MSKRIKEPGRLSRLRRLAKKRLAQHGDEVATVRDGERAVLPRPKGRVK